MSDIYANSGMTGMLCKAGLAIGNSTKDGPGFNNPSGHTGIEFVINGTAHYLAEDLELAFTAGLGTQAAGTVCLILVQVSNASTPVMSYKKGAEVTISSGTVASVALELPGADANNCPVGYVKVSNATNPFIYGTTLLDAAGVTPTYVDFGLGIHDRPATS